MACSDYASWSEFIAQGQFFDALICPFVDSMGVALAGLMVFGTIGLALYIYSGGIELPLVVGIIVGAGRCRLSPPRSSASCWCSVSHWPATS
jgi:hypothetical protein